MELWAEGWQRFHAPRERHTVRPRGTRHLRSVRAPFAPRILSDKMRRIGQGAKG